MRLPKILVLSTQRRSHAPLVGFWIPSASCSRNDRPRAQDERLLLALMSLLAGRGAPPLPTAAAVSLSPFAPPPPSKRPKRGIEP